MSITASLVKELRDKTNAGMMDCKKALGETNGDLEAAVTLLREKGISKAAKKADRDANEGTVAAQVSADGKSGILLAINCETDFVAKNDNFQGLVGEFLDTLSAASAASKEEALEVPFASATLGEHLQTKVIELGENLQLGDFARLTVEQGEGLVASYIHMGGKVGVLIQLAYNNAATGSNEAVQTLIKDLSLHVAASNPAGLKREDIPANLVAAEEEIFRKQLLDEGKPEAMIDKIIPGKMGRFYSETCFLEQGFVKDPSVKVIDLVAQVSKEVSDEISVVTFKRFAIGG